ncbi:MULTISPECIES: TSUP family transporter [unclassified Acidocella]|uniref:TSUP family transporter n=1 Tax=unclassified Acidocella TaxID=2648610 RepID=UPI00028DC9E8|nr:MULTISPECIES: TSUP family transporter [unclassified Acidocella]EKM98374.1 hypothetical protein MXAZACID_15894 [Acidocella sp. MX-AZ02]WBO59280.1 TSUP family transporter [Acidocella sp. MX-AZ03]
MPHLQLALVAFSAFLGATTQRVTGLGFALVASPLLILVLGPFQGVLLANLLTLVLNAVVLAGTWRAAEPRRLALLVPAALVAVQLGAPVARLIPAAWLLTIIGTLVFLALLSVLLLKNVALFKGKAGALAAGALSGFMNVTAGVGGPAITLYAVGTAWDQAKFVASMQVYFGALNLASVAEKGLPHLPLAAVPLLGVALLTGLGLGQILNRRIPARQARQGVLFLALAGSGATIVKGALLLAH